MGGGGRWAEIIIKDECVVEVRCRMACMGAGQPALLKAASGLDNGATAAT